jgi:hypothetical protein
MHIVKRVIAPALASGASVAAVGILATAIGLLEGVIWQAAVIFGSAGTLAGALFSLLRARSHNS